jgi:toxin ParE1/3/4
VTVRGVETTPEADRDLDEIWATIAADSPTQADKFIDRLTERFVTVARMPRGGRARPELAKGLRSFAFRGYVIFYSITADGVLIERVLHGARDVTLIIKKKS